MQNGSRVAKPLHHRHLEVEEIAISRAETIMPLIGRSMKFSYSLQGE
jgi:hypothetical protein